MPKDAFIAAGQSATITVANGDYVRVTTGPQGFATLEAVGSPGLFTGERRWTRINGRQVFGPWQAGTVRISALADAVSYGFGEQSSTDDRDFIATYADASRTALAGADGRPSPYIAQRDSILTATDAFTPPADSVLSKYGRQVANICSAAQVVGVTNVTQALSNERPRFSTYTRRAQINSNSLSEMRFVNLNMTLDPDDLSLSVDVYLEQHPNQNSQFGTPPFIAINLSQGGGTLGPNFDQWVFGSSYLRQGWNTLKCRAADLVGGFSATSNMPIDCTRSRTGTGVDMTAPITYMAVQCTNMNGFVIHVDNPQRSARAKPMIVIGFDANGSSPTDNIFVDQLAPLFRQYGAVGYVTHTHVYEQIAAGGAAWQRMVTLQNEFGWEVLNHTWSHGGTEVGRTATVTITWAAGVATVTYPAAHDIPIGRRYRTRLIGATPVSFNGVQEMTCTTTTQATFTTAEAGSGTATGTITLFQTMAEVFNTDTTENRRLLGHEITDIARLMRSAGMGKAAHVLAYPNNSVPELNCLQPVCAEAGIAFGRGARGGMVFINEFGIDNPLHFGSFELGSGAGATTTPQIIAKINAAINRGEHIWLFGHYIQDETTAGGPVNLDFPPGSGGNPAPPGGSLSGVGGWWYLGQLRRIFDECIMPAVRAGQLEIASASQWAQRLGYGVGR